MPDPIRISVVFDSSGQMQLQRGAAHLTEISNKLVTLATNAKTAGRVVSMVEADLNRFSIMLNRNVGSALNFFNSQFERLYSLASRFARLGFYTLIAQVGTLAYSFSRLAREFMTVNERFGQLEVTLKSVYGSTLTARKIREEIAKITIQSPLQFKDIADTVRAFSAMPSLSAQIGRQASSGEISQQQGFIRKAIELVEQMTTFRPDKMAQDATFAIREAVSGELRSLIRRFEFPSSLLVSASGKSIQELKRAPIEMFNALKKAMDQIITPQAVREMAKQPRFLFNNIMEQVLEIPLLKVGRYGENAGKSFYDTFLNYFYNVLVSSGSFIERRFGPIAKQISESLKRAFEKLVTGFTDATTGKFIESSYTKISEKILDVLSLGKQDLPGRGQLERIYIGFGKMLDYVVDNLDSFVASVEKAFQVILPILEGLGKIFLWIADILSKAFSRSTFAGFATIAGAYLLPSFVRQFSELLGSAVTRSIVNTRAQILSAPLTSMAANARQYQTNLSALTQLGNPAPNRPGMFQVYPTLRGGIASTTPQYIPVAGPLPANLQRGLRQQLTQSGFGSVQGPVWTSQGIPANVSPQVQQRAIAAFNARTTAQQMAMSAGAGGVTARLAAGAGARLAGAGVGAGATNAAMSGVMAVGSVASTVMSVLGVVAVSAAFFTLIDKVSGYLANKAKSFQKTDLQKRGFTEEFGASLGETVGAISSFSADFAGRLDSLAGEKQKEISDAFSEMISGVTIPKGVVEDKAKRGMYESEFSGRLPTEWVPKQLRMVGMTFDQLKDSLEKGQRDYTKLRRAVESADIGSLEELELIKDFVPGGSKPYEKAKAAMESLRQFSNFASDILDRHITSLKQQFPELKDLKATPPLSAKAESLMANLKQEIDTFTASVNILTEGPQFVTNLFERFKPLSQGSNLASQIQDAESQLEKLAIEGDPFTLFTASIREEVQRLTSLQEMEEDFMLNRGRFFEAAMGGPGVKNIQSLISMMRADTKAMQDTDYASLVVSGEQLLDKLKTGQSGREALEIFEKLLDGAITEGIVRPVSGYISLITPELRRFSSLGDSESNTFIANIRDSSSSINEIIRRGGDRFKEFADELDRVPSLLENLPSTENLYDSEREFFSAFERSLGVSNIIRALADALQRDIDRAKTQGDAAVAGYDKSVQDLLKAQQVLILDLQKQAADAARRTNEYLRQAQDLNIGRIMQGVTPSITPNERGRLAQGVSAVQERYGGRGISIPDSLFAYTQKQGAGYTENQRYQREYAEGQVKLFRYISEQITAQSNVSLATSKQLLAEAERQKDMAESLRKLFDDQGKRLKEFHTLRPGESLITEEQIQDAEQRAAQAKTIAEVTQSEFARLRAEAGNLTLMAQDLESQYSQLTLDAQTTLIAGWQSVFDNFKEQANNLTDIGQKAGQAISSGLGDALYEFASRSKTAGEAFEEFGRKLLETVARMLINKAVENFLGIIFGGGKGSLFGGLMGGSNPNNSISFAGSAPYTLSPYGPNAAGGLIPGPSSDKDNIAIGAATGEYIIPSSVVRKFGVKHFDYYKEGKLPPNLPVKNFEEGGLVSAGGYVYPSFAGGGQVRPVVSGSVSNNVPVTVSVSINNAEGGVSTKVDDSSAKDSGEQLARSLRNAIVEELYAQQRQGGSLRRMMGRQ